MESEGAIAEILIPVALSFYIQMYITEPTDESDAYWPRKFIDTSDMVSRRSLTETGQRITSHEIVSNVPKPWDDVMGT